MPSFIFSLATLHARADVVMCAHARVHVHHMLRDSWMLFENLQFGDRLFNRQVTCKTTAKIFHYTVCVFHSVSQWEVPPDFQQVDMHTTQSGSSTAPASSATSHPHSTTMPEEDQNHYPSTTSFGAASPEASDQVLESNVAKRGYCDHKFIFQSSLAFDAKANTQYLEDDCLRIRVKEMVVYSTLSVPKVPS